MRDVALRGVHERRGVKVAIVVLDETGNGSPVSWVGLVCFFLAIVVKIISANDTRAGAKSNLKLKLN